MAVALRALEDASANLEALHDLAVLVADDLANSIEAPKAHALLKGHKALAMQACNNVFRALNQLGQRGAT
jgi:hypothetical protein